MRKRLRLAFTAPLLANHESRVGGTGYWHFSDRFEGIRRIEANGREG